MTGALYVSGDELARATFGLDLGADAAFADVVRAADQGDLDRAEFYRVAKEFVTAHELWQRAVDAKAQT